MIKNYLIACIEEQASPMLIAGLSRIYTFEEVPIKAPGQWQEFGPWLGKIPGQKGSVAYGLCSGPGDGKDVEYVCGVEISGETKESEFPENFILKELPSVTYAVFHHNGHVSGIRQTCDTIWKDWFPESGFKRPENVDFFFERYGEHFDPRTGSGDIEIWIPVQAG